MTALTCMYICTYIRSNFDEVSSCGNSTFVVLMCVIIIKYLHSTMLQSISKESNYVMIDKIYIVNPGIGLGSSQGWQQSLLKKIETPLVGVSKIVKGNKSQNCSLPSYVRQKRTHFWEGKRTTFLHSHGHMEAKNRGPFPSLSVVKSSSWTRQVCM